MTMNKSTSSRTSNLTVPVDMRQIMHYTAEYLINPPHPVTVNVIGCGGTGSQVLNSLARMHSALKALGHTGLYVRAIDPDTVTAANMGRQLFSPADMNTHKCIALIGRINRFFGTDWEGIPLLYNENVDIKTANITISCVDSGAARKGIKAALDKASKEVNVKTRDDRFRSWYREPYHMPYYWMDFGNMMDRGQMVMGTVMSIKQPAGSEHICRSTLPVVSKLHPNILKDSKNNNQGPSCSLAESLGKQDLFINSNLANMGLAILWKMFREMHIKYHGLYLNLETMSVNPIKVK